MKTHKVIFLQTLYSLVLISILGWQSCSNSDQTLQGTWSEKIHDESYMAKQYGIDSVTYKIQLDFNQRRFLASDLPNDNNAYGIMDFSNATHRYVFFIDSVKMIQPNVYAIKSIEENSLMTYDDTLVYHPETKQLTVQQSYGENWVFHHKNLIQKFHGTWKQEMNGKNTQIVLNLYEEIEAPNKAPFHGEKCYGYILSDDIQNCGIVKSAGHHENNSVLLDVRWINDPDTQDQVIVKLQNDNTLTMYDSAYICEDIEIEQTDDGGASLRMNGGVGLLCLIMAAIMAVFIFVETINEYDADDCIIIYTILTTIYSVLLIFVAKYAINESFDTSQILGIWDVVKLYGAVLFVAFAYIAGVFRTLLASSSLCSKPSTLFFIKTVGIFSIAIGILLPLFGEACAPIVYNNFWGCLTYQEGLIPCIIAVGLTSIFVLILIQWLIFIFRTEGVIRWILLILSPLWMIVASGTIMVTTAALTYIAVVVFVIGTVLKFGSHASNDILNHPNEEPVSAPAEDENEIEIDDPDYLGSVKAREYSATGSGKYKGDNGRYYKKDNYGNIVRDLDQE